MQWGLDKTVQHLKDSLHEDQKDTLLMMINGLKRRMAVGSFKQMRPADAEVVLHMIKDMRVPGPNGDHLKKTQ